MKRFVLGALRDDLYCRTSTGEYIIVEMQKRKHPNFVDRTLYYICAVR